MTKYGDPTNSWVYEICLLKLKALDSWREEDLFGFLIGELYMK